jgi:HEAT repeat protein
MMGNTTFVDPNSDLHDRMDELVRYAEIHPKNIDFLIDLLTSSRLRMNAAMALGKTGDKRAIGPLEKMASDQDSGVRAAAEEALRALR